MEQKNNDQPNFKSSVRAISHGRKGNDDVDREWYSQMSFVMFAFSLVLIIATILFVSVGFNPKEANFGKLPWLYASGALFGSVVCFFFSRQLNRPGRDHQGFE